MRGIVRLITLGAILASAGCGGPPPGPPGQRHMEETLRQLEIAKHEIEVADRARDHGGHAGAATRLIDDAIRQVREGIRYRDEHAR